jgi:hypothetical protein
MVLKLRQKHLVTEIPFVENSEQIVDIPQDNPLRRITLSFFVDYTTITTIATAKNDDLLNLVKRVQLIFNGATTKFDVDLKTYFFASTFQNGTKLSRDAFNVAISANNIAKITMTIDFAQLKNNLTDFSGLFNAPAFSSLQLKLQWGDIGDVVSTATTTINSAKCELATTEVYDNGQGENQLDEVVLSAQDIREGVDVTNITKAFGSFGGDELEAKILPVPSTILEHCLVTQNFTTSTNPARSDALITQLRLENVRGGEELIFYDTWLNWKTQNKAEYGLTSADVDAGTIFISWNELRLAGLLNNVVDALKYKFLTALLGSNTNTVRVYKKYIVITQATSTA